MSTHEQEIVNRAYSMIYITNAERDEMLSQVSDSIAKQKIEHAWWTARMDMLDE